MLLAQNISLQRSENKIFSDISLSLGSGQIIVLKGMNGSGKTSLLKSILNIIEPTSGTIYWRGKMLKKTLYDFYKHVTYIADKTSSLKQLTLLENIKIWKKISLSKIDFNQIDSALKTLKLDNYKNKKIYSLSLGEIKKLELLRLIIENKKVWILDEPFSNLDSDSISVMEQTFEDHCVKEGSILFSTHQNINMRRINEEIGL